MGEKREPQASEVEALRGRGRGRPGGRRWEISGASQRGTKAGRKASGGRRDSKGSAALDAWAGLAHTDLECGTPSRSPRGLDRALQFSRSQVISH